MTSAGSQLVTVGVMGLLSLSQQYTYSKVNLKYDLDLDSSDWSIQLIKEPWVLSFIYLQKKKKYILVYILHKT